MVIEPYRIGTRGSPLAIAQTESVVQELKRLYPNDVRIQTMTVSIIQTTGDRVLDRSLADIGGKGLFAKEIELALLDNQIDMAVHCVKDLDSSLPENLMIGCVVKREDPRDVLVTTKAKSFNTLPSGALIGTCSPRRQGQLLYLRPDLKIVMMRGNVQTRLTKLEKGEVDALILAYAGLKRLRLESIITEIFDQSKMLPAVGQGALIIQCRKNDTQVIELLKRLHDEQDGLCIKAERSFLKELDGTCRTPIAGYAQIKDKQLILKGSILAPNGEKAFFDEIKGSPQDAKALGIQLAQNLKTKSGKYYNLWKDK